MMNLLGRLETRLAQNTLSYLNIVFSTFKQNNIKLSYAKAM